MTITVGLTGVGAEGRVGSVATSKRRWTINGWHRLWLVACLLWAIVVATVAFPAYVNARPDYEHDLFRTAALFWGLGSAAMLILGHAIAWAIRGFQTRQ
jgi:hypothetical protein